MYQVLSMDEKPVSVEMLTFENDDFIPIDEERSYFISYDRNGIRKDEENVLHNKLNLR